MEVVIGSLNQTKVTAVHNVFSDVKILKVAAPSNVSAQPIGDQETRQGAINRALNALEMTDANLAIGLEGGVMLIDEQLYLCNWGALAASNKDIYTASGARILLPNRFTDCLLAGTELSDIMEEYTQQTNIRNTDGAIGIFTNQLINRSEMFTHIVKMLKGQLDYWQAN